MSTLRAARGAAGPVGERTRVVAVSVDPEGDTPAVVRRFLGARGLTGEVDYLVGSRAELEATWAAWGVARSVPRDDPELVEHSSLIYGVTASGDLATAYPVGIGARAVARDLPLLARS
jgi:cytochrome oxidase Cu insertion factor (SCO1/SenC/PrrC family)